MVQKPCDCCDGTDVLTPVPIYNPPGLSQVRYRIGSYSSFMESMIARLNQSCPDDEALCVRNDGPYPLRSRLKTRHLNDPSIAWLDAWATVADVLTFYQERVANEGYLATAVRERSLHEISSLVGYRPRPGLSSSVMLAFEVDKPVPAANGVTYQIPRGGILIPEGTAAESTPAPGSNDESQTFETTEAFIGFEHWNAIKLRTTQPQRITPESINSITKLSLKGTGLGLKINDWVFVKLPTVVNPVAYAIDKIAEDQESQLTTIEFQAVGTLPSLSPYLVSSVVPKSAAEYERYRNIRTSAATLKPQVFFFRSQSNIFGWNMPPKSPIADLDVDNLVAAACADLPSPGIFASFLYMFFLVLKIGSNIRAYIFEKRLEPMAESGIGETPDKIYLDGEFSAIREGDFIAIRKSTEPIPTAYEVKRVSVHPRTAYQLRGNATEVQLQTTWWTPFIGAVPAADSVSTIQTTKVYCELQSLELAEQPMSRTISPSSGGVATTFELDGLIEGLFVGQKLAIQGKRVLNGVTLPDMFGEIVVIESIRHQIRTNLFGDRFVTKLRFVGVTHTYLRSSVKLMGNLVEATHGKTVYESVGDGDGFREFLKHQLTASPVSQLPVATLPGSENAIKVIVEDVDWPEVPDFVDRGPTERVFVAKRDFMQRTTLVFGDGADGARPPSGIEIIKSRYRTGLGLRGNVAAGRIDQVAGSTLGVKSVINPLDATGGEDPDGSQLTRTRASLSVMVFDRLVSLGDYQEFALKFAGIGKAAAVFDVVTSIITLTIAANHPGAIASNSKLFLNLNNALMHYGEDGVVIAVQDRRLRYLGVHAKVRIKTLYQWQVVKRQIRNALLEHFSYEHANFGAILYSAEAFQVIQRIDGVIYVELPTFNSVASDATGSTPFPTANDVTLDSDTLCYLSPDFDNLLVVEQIA